MFPGRQDPTFLRDDARRSRRRLTRSALGAIQDATVALPADRAGLRPLLGPGGSIWDIAAAVLGAGCRPVRAILFDKTPKLNWPLAWHQDRTVAVTERIEVPGFGPWTVKDGLLHVAPPFEVLAGTVHGDAAGPSRRGTGDQCAAVGRAGLASARPDRRARRSGDLAAAEPWPA